MFSEVRWPKIIVAAILAEIVPIAALVVIIAVLAPASEGEAQQTAEWLGQYVGPIGGALAAFVFAIWVARSLMRNRVAAGALLGFLVALLDAALLILSWQQFRWLFVISGIGRVVAGALGGHVAAKLFSPKQADRAD